MSDIVVFGSLNADLVLKVPTLPTAGQTVLGGSVRPHNGVREPTRR
jgi:sugar/nucleoside kinase (ribokinase family)